MQVGRPQLIAEYLGESISRVVAYPGSAVWSWLNAGWLLVFLIVLAVTKASRTWVIASLVILPALATVITADGGRVFGMIVLPAYLIAAVWFGRQTLEKSENSKALIGAFVLALLVLPITIQGQGWFFSQIFGLLGRII